MESAMSLKINLRPVYSAVIHSGIWEGPCRFGALNVLEPEYEKATSLKSMERWHNNLKNNLDPNYVNVLDPIFVPFSENFFVSDEQLKEIAPNKDEVDLIIFSYRVPGIERLGIPICMLDVGPTSLDVVAHYRDIGLEAYVSHDYTEFNTLLKNLQVKKALKNTRLLVLSGGEANSVGVMSSNPDLYSLTLKYGIRTITRSYRDLFDYFKENNSERKDKANSILKNAIKSEVGEEDLCNDLAFYDAVVDMMNTYKANAFTTVCKELCASQIPQKFKCVPCLTHTLLRDAKLPTACEQDINVWLANTILMYLTKKSVYMGNPFLYFKNTPLNEHNVNRTVISGNPDGYDEELLRIEHAVPTLKMQGYDKEDMPYSLGSFTDAGWGTKVQIDMTKSPEKKVTIARFDRHSEKMIVVTGTIVATTYVKNGCSPAVYYRLDGDVRGFRHALAEHGYGHHLSVVYGDYVEELKSLADVVGFKLEVYGK